MLTELHDSSIFYPFRGTHPSPRVEQPNLIITSTLRKYLTQLRRPSPPLLTLRRETSRRRPKPRIPTHQTKPQASPLQAAHSSHTRFICAPHVGTFAAPESIRFCLVQDPSPSTYLAPHRIASSLDEIPTSPRTHACKAKQRKATTKADATPRAPLHSLSTPHPTLPTPVPALPYPGSDGTCLTHC